MTEHQGLVERLRKFAGGTDQAQHDKWCRRKDVPVNGYSAEGVAMRQAADEIERLSASLAAMEKREVALHRIAEAQHEGDCKFKFCPRWECPTCPGAEIIARTALQAKDGEA